MSGTNLEKLQRKLGYQFKDERLLTLAITHRSFSSTNNERLEFLGDSILNFVIGEDLFTRFEKAREGQLSRLRAKMVKRQTLAEIAREMDLGDFLIMGSGELKSGGFSRDSILSDAVEAIIGAIYLDSDLDAARGRVLAWSLSRLESLSLKQTLKDAKSRLQEYLQGQQASLPEYEVVEVTGESHNQTFTIACHTGLLPEPLVATGASRRMAEQEAAKLVLVALGAEDDGA